MTNNNTATSKLRLKPGLHAITAVSLRAGNGRTSANGTATAHPPEPAPVADPATTVVNRFLRTAQAGRYGTASSGERTAHRLAAALYDIGDDLALLDSGTLEGFLKLARLAAGPWPTDDSKSKIYSAIEAAGKKP